MRGLNLLHSILLVMSIHPIQRNQLSTKNDVHSHDNRNPEAFELLLCRYNSAFVMLNSEIVGRVLLLGNRSVMTGRSSVQLAIVVSLMVDPQSS